LFFFPRADASVPPPLRKRDTYFLTCVGLFPRWRRSPMARAYTRMVRGVLFAGLLILRFSLFVSGFLLFLVCELSVCHRASQRVFRLVDRDFFWMSTLLSSKRLLFRATR